MKLSLMYFIKNEWPFIGYSLNSMLPYVDETVIWDEAPGNAEIPIFFPDAKIKRHIHRPIDVMNQKAYEKIFNDALKACTGDWILWMHADMVAYNADVLKSEIERIARANPDALHLSIRVTSFAKDLRTMWVGRGRKDRWPMIVRNDFGLHYYGAYGHVNEGFYFSDITGDVHKDIWSTRTPYPIYPTEFHVAHLCELKSTERREERMRKVLRNQGLPEAHIEAVVQNHPRVTLKPNTDLGFGIKRASKKDIPIVLRDLKYGSLDPED